MGAAHELAELTPFVRRCAELDPDNPVRLRSVQAPGLVVTSAFAVLPFGALVERIIATPGHPLGDHTHRAAELLTWLEAASAGLDSDGDAAAAPPELPSPPDRGAEWRGSLPPPGGWRRVEDVPDAVVRDLVRTGAQAAKDAAVVENLPGGRPSDTLVGALLDSVVLTVHDDENPAGPGTDVTLRSLTAVTRMGFVARGQGVRVDRARRWSRVAARYGNVYAEIRTTGLTLV